MIRRPPTLFHLSEEQESEIRKLISAHVEKHPSRPANPEGRSSQVTRSGPAARCENDDEAPMEFDFDE